MCTYITLLRTKLPHLQFTSCRSYFKEVGLWTVRTWVCERRSTTLVYFWICTCSTSCMGRPFHRVTNTIAVARWAWPCFLRKIGLRTDALRALCADAYAYAYDVRKTVMHCILYNDASEDRHTTPLNSVMFTMDEQPASLWLLLPTVFIGIKAI